MNQTFMVYLAAPYSSPDPECVENRIRAFCSKDSELSGGGIITVSPLFKHLLFINGSKLPSDWAYWERYSYVLLSRCDYLVVLKLPGWEESVGVQGEIKYALDNGINIVYIDPLDNALESFVRQTIDERVEGINDPNG
jgi:hypothetical protein